MLQAKMPEVHFTRLLRLSFQWQLIVGILLHNITLVVALSLIECCKIEGC